MMKKLLIIIVIGIFVAGCSKKNVQLEDDLTPRFDKAMDFFERDKFLRAKDEFDYIIITDPGSKIANESQYYKAESMFQMEEYDKASISFDRYVRFSPDYNKIEKARYRICECAIYSSNSYQREQSQTQYASLALARVYLGTKPNDPQPTLTTHDT